MKKYVARPDTWYDVGTFVEIIAGPWPCSDTPGGPNIGYALCRGIRDGECDEELCSMDEFDVVEVIDGG